ncbi:hypothetical protein NTJ28_002457 [Flavobacterium psychrophilum]|nr:hypothetical protein [Flavobacterium psychrophilum]
MLSHDVLPSPALLDFLREQALSKTPQSGGSLAVIFENHEFKRTNQMKNIIFITLILSSFCSFGQNDSIEKRIFNIGKEKTKLIKVENIIIDSIKVKVSVYEDRIESESYFEKSKSNLTTTYLLVKNSFSKIVTKENCSFRPADFWRTYIYEFKDGIIVEEEERLYSSAQIEGIAGRLEKKVNESYNKTLNSEFLKKYVLILFEKIKNYR